MSLIESQPDALATTYAKSLFQLAHARGGRAAVEETQAELEDILELARQDRRFGEFLSSRVLGQNERTASLLKIFKGRVTDLTLRFLLVLQAKHRLRHLPSITAAFDGLAQKAFGRVEVDVYTASPLPPEELSAVRERLARTLGKDVVVHPYTDGSMIGGVKFRIGDQLIDASLATKLRRLRDQFANEGSARLRARVSSILSEGV